MIESTDPRLRDLDLLPVDADWMDAILADGATLPAAFYTDPSIARLEDEAIFRRAWQIVGIEAELPNPGDYFTTDIAGSSFKVPIVVVRDEELNLRAFINVCRHRAHLVATGSGNRKTLQCTYHGWVYGLNGCLRGVPRQHEGGLPPFDTLGLYPLPLDTWAGFVFVGLEPQESLAEFIGELPQVLEQQGYGFPFARENIDAGHEYARREYEHTTYANWKVYIENTVECYHCPTTHTHSFSDVYKVDPQVYVHREFDRGIYHATWYQDVVAGRLGLADRSGSPEYQFYFLFPNMFFGGGKRTAEAAGFSRRMPHTVDETRTVGVRYTLPTAGSYYPDEEIQRELEEAGRLTGEEDREVVARVQDGLRSGLYEYGYTLPESERNMRHFYKLVWDSLAPSFR